MVELGYHLSSEEHGPDALVDDAVRAEDVGFEFYESEVLPSFS